MRLPSVVVLYLQPGKLSGYLGEIAHTHTHTLWTVDICLMVSVEICQTH